MNGKFITIYNFILDRLEYDEYGHLKNSGILAGQLANQLGFTYYIAAEINNAFLGVQNLSGNKDNDARKLSSNVVERIWEN